MKIVIAMDSFKGSLSAERACKAVAEGLLSVRPDLEVVVRPMADGGEGTASAMIAARNGRWAVTEATGPLPDMKVQAGYAWFDSDKTALVEMASASGLVLLSTPQRNPLKTTTYGTGELIQAVAKRSCERIWLAVGGSATVDGGTGAAMALGWRFLDKDGLPLRLATRVGAAGKAVAPGGGDLHRIKKIIPPARLDLPPVDVLCDVENRLCGPQGAARTFGPQKGATPEMVDQLERGLAHLADMVKSQFGKDIDVPGAGAAGGLAAGAIAFMNAKLVSGVDAIIECTNLTEEIDTAEWVITGEGCFDEQSLRGKVVSGIVRAAAKSKVRVAVLAGSVNLTKEEYQSFGVADAISAKKPDMPLDYAMTQGSLLLAEAAAEFARRHCL